MAAAYLVIVTLKIVCLFELTNYDFFFAVAMIFSLLKRGVSVL